MAKLKWKHSRNRDTGRTATIRIRKDKRRANHSKYILVGTKLVLKPQWTDEETGKELEVSNKSNLIG